MAIMAVAENCSRAIAGSAAINGALTTTASKIASPAAAMHFLNIPSSVCCFVNRERADNARSTASTHSTPRAG